MKSVIVTGATGGIGRAVCRRFRDAGYFVGIGYFSNSAAARSLEKELGGMALGFDVSDAAQTERAFEAFSSYAGGLDVLVANAGIALPVKPAIDAFPEEFDKVFSVNVKGVYNCDVSAVKRMLAKGGSIVNVSSMFGISGGSCEALYSASKAAVIGLTQALAREYCSAGIRVNAVAPGMTDTKMNDMLGERDKAVAVSEIPLGRMATPEEIADAVFFAAENGFMTGAVINISGGEVI